MIFLALFLALAVSCGRRPSAAAPSQAAAAEPDIPTAAQPKLKTIKLYLGAQEMDAELAANDVQRQTGMMFRTQMGENDGMLFIFPWPHRTAFWMKNTPLPLSAAYIDSEGMIREIHDFKPFDTNTVTAASDRIQYVLETKQGWFQRNNISTGALVKTEHGTLQATFFRRP